MKFCNKCKEEKIFDDFNWRNKSKNTYQPYCKECTRKYGMERHFANHEHNLSRKRVNNKRNYNKRIEIFKNLLLNKFCVDCGCKDIRILEFDHVRGKKLFNVGEFVRLNLTHESLLNEISKCEIRCVVCHRIKSLTESKSWRINWYNEINNIGG